MKLLAFTEGANHVCYRYRLAAYSDALHGRGWELRAIPLSKRSATRVWRFLKAAQADVVLLQRILLPLWQLALLRKSARKLIFDFDDAIFHRDSFHPKGRESWSRLARFWATVNACDAVIAGNEYLAERAAQYAPESNVHLIPTCVDPARYSLAPHSRPAGQVRLAWIGQHSTLEYLRKAAPVLTEAGKRVDGLELCVVADRFPLLRDLRVIQKPWRATAEGRLLADADIGVSWLTDDSWSAGKCGLKVLQYMSAGLPVVANPVAMNREMVLHGQTGFLAETPEQWSEAIATLAANPALRRRMGEAGRRLVAKRYCVSRWSDRFVSRIEQVAATPSTATRPAFRQKNSADYRLFGDRVRGDDLPINLRWEAGKPAFSQHAMEDEELPVAMSGWGDEATPLDFHLTMNTPHAG